MKIKPLLGCLVAAGVVLGLGNLASPAKAHGGQPHPKCKRGYEPNDQHKCVPKNGGARPHAHRASQSRHPT